MALLRGSTGAVSASDLATSWAEDAQRGRALDGLVQDGLVEPTGDGRFRLPGEVPTVAVDDGAPGARPGAQATG